MDRPGIIVFQAARLLRESVAILLESTPPDLDLEQLTATMEGVPGVTEVHDLHVWSLSTELRVLSAHVIVAGDPTLQESQAIGAMIKRAVAQPFAIAHSTLELECDRCNDEDEDPCRMEPFTGVRTMHNHG
jgi:cobalt-zinc-cadmium efflux system protein